MDERQVASGQFELPLEAAEAGWLFTPEGERAWVPGWDPHYPAGEPSEQPGTVFVTSAHGVDTTWVVISIDRSEHVAGYARVTAGQHAGTVRVKCSDTRPGYCSVTVTYDMTTLDNADASVLDPYRGDAFDAMMESWSVAIGEYLA